MATPITSNIFKSLVTDSLNKVFDEEYAKLSGQLFPEEDPAMYEQEVDFGD